MNDALKTALEGFKPQIAEDYVAIVSSTFADFVQRFGVAMKGIANSSSYRYWAGSVRPVCRWVQVTRDVGMYEIDDALLAKDAAEFADDCIKAWEQKINHKLGDLDSYEIRDVTGSTFAIHGTRGGHKVVIGQDRIFKVSSKGTPFYQFPSRIYVDGKFTPEAAYKRMIAA